MSERTPDQRTEQVGPEYQFPGTVEHDCLSGLPADAPQRSWPAAEWDTGRGSPEVIRRDLFKLYKALNEYHIARGGGRLTIEGFKELIQSAVGVEA
jgi:hypothetical protein